LLWALQDVSFQVEPGTTLGIIGGNGSGKSTLLRLIARMMRPTRGAIGVRGRLSLLSHLGGGFHGDLTGRENLFLQGAILGLSGRELRAKAGAIFAYAELEPFAGIAVKHYSSGMALRLGFAIAAHLDPEVLLIDEAFAVGDTAFRDRCLGRVLGFKAAGVTMVLVSHERYLVEQLCDRALLLDRGRVAALGKPEEAFESYERLIDAEPAGARQVAGTEDESPLVVEGVRVDGNADGVTPVLAMDQPMTVRIELRATRDVARATVGVQIAREWHILHGTRSNRQGIDITARAGERVGLEVEYPSLGLSRGSYAVHVAVHEHRLAEAPLLVVKRAARFRVIHTEAEGVGLVRLPHVWRRLTP
jgi:ABC-type polysaccharide/polyol phosphate transport system ATPase subunit